ncbi:metallophosphoesterase family protein [Oricola cellulosilytica]|uniref:Metallophosphoesterase n=1 Tax=Oricola cellulosilytica TaxID=1429082 RepID=A0A4R0PDH2_9HYPH|nr:metallophosphoesterase [Oricola cellulosilytica]TCD15356.1 metallophosphoesterase [Oricola cellulosilytica]
MAFLLAHISDIHLGPLPDVRFVDLMSKRITGYINWKRNRASHMISSTLGELVDAMQAQKPDHIAVTGDLTNLALDEEIAGAALWLKSLGPAENVSTIPGNHDAYVRGSLAKSVAAWSANMAGDRDGIVRTRSGFPYIRRRGNVALIGVNSAVATAPFMASGIFGSRHARGLRQALEKTGKEGLFRVILIHHPPVRRAATPQKRLYGIGLFQKVVREYGAELVLHGHTHLPQRHAIGGIDGAEVPVIGVPAAGQSPGGKKPAAAFNLFRIGGAAGQWTCDLEEHSLTGMTGETAITDRRKLSG